MSTGGFPVSTKEFNTGVSRKRRKLVCKHWRIRIFGAHRRIGRGWQTYRPAAKCTAKAVPPHRAGREERPQEGATNAALPCGWWSREASTGRAPGTIYTSPLGAITKG